MMNYPVDTTQKPDVTAFFDDTTHTLTYIVKDPASDACAVIDSVTDMDYAAGRISFEQADQLIDTIRNRGLRLEWLIETHVHADHLSAAPYIQRQLGGRIGIGANITVVQDTFARIFDEGNEFPRDGSQFDRLFEDGETYTIGSLTAFAMHTPGHTPACMTHVFGDAMFVGDTLFMPDGGTARADFPGGDPGILYDSIQHILSLPDRMRIFVCHDYGPGGREIRWETTVAEERAKNIHVGGGCTREDYIKLRTKRDALLRMPKLIIPSMQVNMRAGQLPPSEGSGARFLKVPVNAL